MNKRKPLNRGNQKENPSPSRRGNGNRTGPRKGDKPEPQTGGKAGSQKPWKSGSDTHVGKPARSRPARAAANPATRTPPRSTQKNAQKNNDWLYGAHPVLEALGNPKRTLHKLVATARAADVLAPELAARIKPELATTEEISNLLPDGAVHQGLALHTAPLPEMDLEDVLAGYDVSKAAPLLFLDQVTDPHNVGAIMRSAAAFGAAAVIVQDRHAPQVTGLMAKSASGAIEHMPLIRVTNLSRALEKVGDEGYFRLGLAGEAEAILGKEELPGKIALVLGAEGPGMRRLTREKCDLLVKLPTSEPISSLNVSNAAAVALFAVSR